MKVDDLKVNQLIEIETEIDNQQNIKYLPSRIEEIKGDYIYISVPMYRRQLMPLRVGENIKIAFTYKEKSYAFFTAVVARKWQQVPLLVIEKPNQLIKIQRRDFVRLPVKLKVRFKTADKDEPYREGITLDVSGGGTLFLTTAPVEAGQIIDLEIFLPGRETFTCPGRVIRLLEKAKKEGDNNKIALEFYEITEGKRDKIINFLFEKQREWIQKGLLE